MNILDEAARQNREIVTRDGRKPEWIHWLPNYGMRGAYVFGLEGDAFFVKPEGGYLTSGTSRDGSEMHDLILAPKKATIWYQTFGGKIVTLSTRPPDPTESALWHFVDVSLP